MLQPDEPATHQIIEAPPARFAQALIPVSSGFVVLRSPNRATHLTENGQLIDHSTVRLGPRYASFDVATAFAQDQTSNRFWVARGATGGHSGPQVRSFEVSARGVSSGVVQHTNVLESREVWLFGDASRWMAISNGSTLRGRGDNRGFQLGIHVTFPERSESIRLGSGRAVAVHHVARTADGYAMIYTPAAADDASRRRFVSFSRDGTDVRGRWLAGEAPAPFEDRVEVSVIRQQRNWFLVRKNAAGNRLHDDIQVGRGAVAASRGFPERATALATPNGAITAHIERSDGRQTVILSRIRCEDP